MSDGRDGCDAHVRRVKRCVTNMTPALMGLRLTSSPVVLTYHALAESVSSCRSGNRVPSLAENKSTCRWRRSNASY
jgi:hypothetical protein